MADRHMRAAIAAMTGVFMSFGGAPALADGIKPCWSGLTIGLNAGAGDAFSGVTELFVDSVEPLNFGDAPPEDQIFEARIANSVRSGHVIGAGIAYAINDVASIKLEYQAIDLGKLQGKAPVTFIATGGDSGQTASIRPIDVEFQTVRIGLNIKLGFAQ